MTTTASPLTKLIEEHLNNVDKVFDDRRSIIPCIDYVIKQIEDSEKRCLYISRLLTALSTLSKIPLEKPKASAKRNLIELKLIVTSGTILTPPGLLIQTEPE